MKETLKTTTNSSVYNKLRTREVHTYLNICFCCYDIFDSIYGGENFVREYDRNWKRFRKHQYKDVIDMAIYPEENRHES